MGRVMNHPSATLVVSLLAVSILSASYGFQVSFSVASIRRPADHHPAATTSAVSRQSRNSKLRLSDDTPNHRQTPHVHQHVAPSQYTMDEQGNKWRLCAAAAVLHSSRPQQVLVGKRICHTSSNSSYWQCPQGGVQDVEDDRLGVRGTPTQETIQQAAARELYEEMGLVVNQHVVELAMPDHELLPSVRYATRGTDAWMEREGFQGQELHWVLFQCTDDNETDAENMCDLTGLNGEHAEFSAAKWSGVDELLVHVEDKKREAYQVLVDYINNSKEGEEDNSKLNYSHVNSDEDARSQFGTRAYWDSVYIGQGDFPQDEYSWYYGWETIKKYWTSAVPDKGSRVLLPGIGNDSILLDLFGSGYKNLVAFDYSEHAIDRQRDLLWFDPKAAELVELRQMDARRLDETWTGLFDVVLEKGALDAIYLSGEGNVELAVKELKRVLRPGGFLVSVSGVVPEELRRSLFSDWEWLRDGSDDLQAGCFVLQASP